MDALYQPAFWGPLAVFGLLSLGLFVSAFQGYMKVRQLYTFVMKFHESGDVGVFGSMVEDSIRGTKIKAEKHGAISVRSHRAGAQEAYAHCVTAVETFPQLGLLGTVIGLGMALVGADGTALDEASLGLALVTTFLGLLFSLIVRWTLERPAYGKLAMILEFMDDDDLVRDAAAEGEKKVRAANTVE